MSSMPSSTEDQDGQQDAGGAKRRSSGPVTGAQVKAAAAASGGTAKLATKAIGEERVAAVANATIGELTDPIGRQIYWLPMAWMWGTLFLGGFVVIPLHWIYMILGLIGVPRFNASMVKWFMFIVNNCIFFSLLTIAYIMIMGLLEITRCASDFFCVVGLIREAI